VVDCIAGAVYAIVTFVAVNWAFDRSEKRVPQPAAVS